MALLVSFALSSLLHPPQSPLLKVDGQQWTRIRSIFLRSSSALNNLSLMLSKGTITTKKWDCYCTVRASFEDQCMCLSNHSAVGCYTRVITGYWIGPDLEDGWGFVEAVINAVR